MNRFLSLALAAGVLVAVGGFTWVKMSGEAAMDTSDTCGAAAHADKIGTPHTDHDFTDPDHPHRIIPPNSAVTLDHRPDRLNVDVDEGGVITRIWCG
ncbi:I78 family peptidase inhibitor [Roseovarius sp. ZX-A-9]|uniref:I78 family peptidase inhibitor n=1 Tax=Roseovarius sp. ZX-A-9 TaxID=3014783 RepID=UPI00232A7DDB|nr:I78 family peptidase inhibitor [Roseovarius sp. ZX-A-9]